MDDNCSNLAETIKFYKEMEIRFKIEKASPSDSKGMKNCVVKAYRHYIPRTGIPPGPMLNNYDEVIEKYDSFVIRHDGSIVGILVLMIFERGLLLDNIAVHPEYQGKGLGKMLMKYAEKKALKSGHSEIYLYTHELMVENIEMYKMFGYVETDRRFERGRPRVYMCKSL